MTSNRCAKLWTGLTLETLIIFKGIDKKSNVGLYFEKKGRVLY